MAKLGERSTALTPTEQNALVDAEWITSTEFSAVNWKSDVVPCLMKVLESPTESDQEKSLNSWATADSRLMESVTAKLALPGDGKSTT